MRSAWSGYVMTCFCCITGTTIIYSVHEHVFDSPWLCDVNQEQIEFIGYISITFVHK